MEVNEAPNANQWHCPPGHVAVTCQDPEGQGHTVLTTVADYLELRQVLGRERSQVAPVWEGAVALCHLAARGELAPEDLDVLLPAVLAVLLFHPSRPMRQRLARAIRATLDATGGCHVRAVIRPQGIAWSVQAPRQTIH